MGSRTRFSRDKQFICQSQSVNLFFPPDVNKGDLHNVHMLAWAKEFKNIILPKK